MKGDSERIGTFNVGAEKYFQKFVSSASSSMLNSLPYMHILCNHIGEFMTIHYHLFGWGYGVYCCHAGEHLNKVIKTVESTGTNYDSKRFYTIAHFLKNKSCPLHPSHPHIEFEESETEE